MCSKLFENFTSTSEKTVDKFWHPIRMNIGFEEFKTALIKHYENCAYEENDYGEILFYVDGFEVTFALSKTDGASSLLNISVFSKKKRGQTCAYLEETIEMIKLKFKSYIMFQ